MGIMNFILGTQLDDQPVKPRRRSDKDAFRDPADAKKSSKHKPASGNAIATPQYAEYFPIPTGIQLFYVSDNFRATPYQYFLHLINREDSEKEAFREIEARKNCGIIKEVYYYVDAAGSRLRPVSDELQETLLKDRARLQKEYEEAKAEDDRKKRQKKAQPAEQGGAGGLTTDAVAELAERFAKKMGATDDEALWAAAVAIDAALAGPIGATGIQKAVKDALTRIRSAPPDEAAKKDDAADGGAPEPLSGGSSDADGDPFTENYT